MSISSNGQFAYFKTPDFDDIGLGTYAGFVSNVNAQGGYALAAAIYVTVIDSGGCDPNCPPVRGAIRNTRPESRKLSSIIRLTSAHPRG
jgi:hypothetical protein